MSDYANSAEVVAMRQHVLRTKILDKRGQVITGKEWTSAVWPSIGVLRMATKDLNLMFDGSDLHHTTKLGMSTDWEVQ
jgi:hypothetical protein